MTLNCTVIVILARGSPGQGSPMLAGSSPKNLKNINDGRLRDGLMCNAFIEKNNFLFS